VACMNRKVCDDFDVIAAYFDTMPGLTRSPSPSE